MSTRQYSKYQEKWLRMRLLQRKFDQHDRLIKSIGASMKYPLVFLLTFTMMFVC